MELVDKLKIVGLAVTGVVIGIAAKKENEKARKEAEELIEKTRMAVFESEKLIADAKNEIKQIDDAMKLMDYTESEAFKEKLQRTMKPDIFSNFEKQ